MVWLCASASSCLCVNLGGAGAPVSCIWCISWFESVTRGRRYGTVFNTEAQRLRDTEAAGGGHHGIHGKGRYGSVPLRRRVSVLISAVPEPLFRVFGVFRGFSAGTRSPGNITIHDFMNGERSILSPMEIENDNGSYLSVQAADVKVISPK